MTYGLAVWALYVLCWVRHLSDCASQIREEGEKGGWRLESGTLLNILSPWRTLGWLTLWKQRPHRGQIQSNVLRADRFNQSAAGCYSPLRFSLGGRLLVQDFHRRRSETMLVKKLQNEKQDKTENDNVSLGLPLVGIFFLLLHHKNCTLPSFQQENLLVAQQP